MHKNTIFIYRYKRERERERVKHSSNVSANYYFVVKIIIYHKIVFFDDIKKLERVSLLEKMKSK